MDFHTSLSECMSSLLPHERTPQNLEASNDNHLLAHLSGGWQFGLGSAGKFFCWICPVLLVWCSQLEDFLRPGGPWWCHIQV